MAISGTDWLELPLMLYKAFFFAGLNFREPLSNSYGLWNIVKNVPPSIGSWNSHWLEALFFQYGPSLYMVIFDSYSHSQRVLGLHPTWQSAPIRKIPHMTRLASHGRRDFDSGAYCSLESWRGPQSLEPGVARAKGLIFTFWKANIVLLKITISNGKPTILVAILNRYVTN